jgi:beta-lactamase regulating signal transducer with metallopeptidase domain
MQDLLTAEAVLLLADTLLTVVLLKGTLLAAAVAVGIRLARRTSAAQRSGMWTAAFGSLLALFVAWSVIPWWNAEFLRFPRVLFRPLGPASTDTGATRQVAEAGMPVADGVMGAVTSVPAASYLAVIWMLGALLLLGRFAFQRGQVEALARRAAPVRSTRCLSMVARICRELGVSRPVRLVIGSSMASPAVFGMRRPVLMLPPEAASWPEDRLAAVLYHEIAHIQRRDYAALMLFEFVRIVYWINPIVTLVARQARESLDLACDDAALRAGVPAPSYARHLVDLARTLGRPAGAHVALPLVGCAGLRGRIGAILARDADRAPMPLRSFGRLAVIALAVAASLGSANLWICESADGPAPPAAGPPDAST